MEIKLVWTTISSGLWYLEFEELRGTSKPGDQRTEREGTEAN